LNKQNILFHKLIQQFAQNVILNLLNKVINEHQLLHYLIHIFEMLNQLKVNIELFMMKFLQNKQKANYNFKNYMIL